MSMESYMEMSMEFSIEMSMELSIDRSKSENDKVERTCNNSKDMQKSSPYKLYTI